MDFNTGGGSGRPDDRPLYGDETGGPVRGPERGPVGGSGGEFNLQDPVNSFISTVRGVILNPVGFFRGIARQGDFVNPLIFALICGVVNGILGGIVGFLISLAFAGDPDFGLAGSFGSLILNTILAPIYVIVALGIVSGIYHLLVLLFVRPSNAGFEATFRVVSYVQALQLISWIPIVNIIAGIYGIVLSVLGIREVHSTTTGKAALVVLIPVAVIILLAILIGAALVALLLGSQQQGL